MFYEAPQDDTPNVAVDRKNKSPYSPLKKQNEGKFSMPNIFK